MEESELKFEREDLTGIIPVGTYLFDAARRMGVEVECERLGESDECAMRVTAGGEFLSEPTKAEIEHLSEERRANGERLACQAKIEKAGDITIMTTKKEEPAKEDYEVKREAYRKEFEDLPLEKKISSLMELEAIALGDTLSFVVNSPQMIIGKLIGVLAEFGFKLDDDAKKQTRPAEHQPADSDAPSVSEETDADEEIPSVTEEGKIEDTEPSVAEIVEDDKEKDPPPSV